MTMEVNVVQHQAGWEEAFEIEKHQLDEAFGNAIKGIHHIGSTSIPGIVAKPIIDVLVVASSINRIDSRNNAMEALGYECMGEFGIPGRRYFRKNDSGGKRSHHVHTFQKGSPDIERHLAFRDYLIAHPNTAREYSDLKKKLVLNHPHDIEAYMKGKDPFIKRIESEALLWWRQLSGNSG